MPTRRSFAAVGMTSAMLCASLIGLGATATHASAESCKVKATGKVTAVGFLGSQERGTETFTDNGCKFNVRATVDCLDGTDTGIQTGHGGILYGDGKSWYTCDITQDLLSVLPEYYNGQKWVVFRNSN